MYVDCVKEQSYGLRKAKQIAGLARDYPSAPSPLRGYHHYPRISKQGYRHIWQPENKMPNQRSIIDSSTGYPAQHKLFIAVAIDEDCKTTDAYATAIYSAWHIFCVDAASTTERPSCSFNLRG